MRAAVLHEFGGPENLEVTEVPDPTPSEDEILVAVSACGVCGHDLLARRGKLGTPLPAILGHEISGVVAARGRAVTSFEVGDRVTLVQRDPCGDCRYCAAGTENLCRGGRGFYGEDRPGGYAEYVLASGRNAVRLPEGISERAAAVLPCGVATGWHALKRVGAASGDVVVVTAASGGVGVHALQLCRHLGTEVIAVTTSGEHRDALLELGATHVVTLTNGAPPLRQQVRELTGGRLADVVLEIAGPPTFAQSVEALAGGGRLALIGNVEPRDVSLSPGLVIVKELSVVGSAHGTREDLEEVVDLVSAGHVQPLVDEEIPLSEVRRAHDHGPRRGLGRRLLVPSLS